MNLKTSLLPIVDCYIFFGIGDISQIRQKTGYFGKSIKLCFLYFLRLLVDYPVLQATFPEC